MVEATCNACGKPFKAKTAKKQFCERKACQRKRARARQRTARAPGAEVVALADHREDDGSGSRSTNVAARARVELAAAGVLETSLGQAALALALRLDQPGEDSGSSLAAVRRDYAKALADALKDAEDADDNVSNIRAFRKRRQAGA